MQGLSDEADNFWYLGTWAMRQFYIVYKLTNGPSDTLAYIAIMDSREKSINEKGNPSDLDPKNPISVTVIVLIVVSLMVVIGMLIICIQHLRNKRLEGKVNEYAEGHSGSMINQKQVNLSFSDCDREDTIVSTSS